MAEQTWHLRKAGNGDEFGPVSMDTLRAWGAEAKISPMDKLSSDGKESWLRAPMVPELQMDWLVEMPDSYLYGPTNLAALQEFLALGEIDEDVQLINCKAGTDHRLGDLPVFQDSPHQRRSSTSTFVGTQWPSERREATDPDATSRVALLERDIIGYQKALGEWQEAYRQLRQQFVEATGHEPL